ncbi:hypothetical protein LTR36_004997 [Oleoguttula mirabilis]|uniref:Ima1 N-terminal domain-containing protein n=1 Tax=Oleoguttula mirabilis TaxID=1507867 RepID=A0AAV9JVR3_9PEZI|nr:hypothetical protein LTR36_004997 [Oleoguttula mirabilis]
MAFFRRIHCHFCGTRSAYSKSSGVPEFQCTSCEAVNFLDAKGNIIDTPASVAAQSQHQSAEPRPAFHTFTQDLPETLNHQHGQAFCNTCLNNQRVYLETLSNYLPDEDHPEYQKFEDALPQFKRDLEARWPQICRKCAPTAQGKINRADYYAGTQNLAVLGRKTLARRGASARGMRDDWGKWSMRVLLNLVGMVYYASLLAQVAWHAYAIFTTIFSAGTDKPTATDFAFDATPRDCVRLTLGMRFNQPCYQLLGTYMTRALITSACLLWYNPGLKAWYHHTHRMEAVTGQAEYFRMQVVMLAVRAVAYYKLSDPAVTASLTTQQLLAAHAFMMMFMAIVQWVSNLATRPVIFKLKLNMMPKPEERDVLGALAGPGDERITPQASSIPPSQLFARDRTAPFPIANLAPQRSTYQKSAIPSPPPSDETDEEGDAMGMDWQPSLQSQMPGAKIDRTFRPRLTPPKPKQQSVRSTYNHGTTQGLGWSGLRDELFGIQDNLQVDAEREQREAEERAKLRYQPPAELNPFRGRLPQAPMSMERKLRNPITQVSFKKAPVTKQQDFMSQMRSGIEQGETFAQEQEVKKQHAQARLRHREDDDEDEFSPAKLRTRGGLELKASQWRLPTDVPQATGLEDMFAGNSFRIADEPAFIGDSAKRRWQEDSSRILKVVVGVAVPIALLTVGWNVQAVRRTVCLWLVGWMEEVGY